MAEQNVWTRSANRNNGNNTFIVNSSGNVNNNNNNVNWDSCGRRPALMNKTKNESE